MLSATTTLRQVALLLFVAALTSVVQNRATLADDGSPKIMQSSDLIVVRIPKSNTFAAYSKHTGEWTRHTFDKDSTIAPVAGASVCAFSVKGKATSELAAVDHNGRWHIQKLSAATSSLCSPIVSSHIAVFTVDRHSYAFSATKGKWDSISAVGAVVASDVAILVDSTQVAAFSAECPYWSVLKTSTDTRKKK
jgi:hypothetical protein